MTSSWGAVPSVQTDIHHAWHVGVVLVRPCLITMGTQMPSVVSWHVLLELLFLDYSKCLFFALNLFLWLLSMSFNPRPIHNLIGH